ncbi:MAG: PKD domain-containing protein [Limisphaerales bacterium]
MLIGCDEYTSGTITGTLNVDISAATTNVAAGYPLSFVGMIAGHASNNFWDFGDGLSASNQPYVSHAWTIAGDYEVVFRAFNESNPAGC